VDEKPGVYELKCTTEWADKASLTVEPNHTSYVRLSILPGVFVGHILPTVVYEGEALEEIKDCHLYSAENRSEDPVSH